MYLIRQSEEADEKPSSFKTDTQNFGASKGT